GQLEQAQQPRLERFARGPLPTFQEAAASGLRPPFPGHAAPYVINRAQHACHIPQSRLFGAALLYRPGRLAFEADDAESISRLQHLAEVVIAMDLDLAERVGLQLNCPK